MRENRPSGSEGGAGFNSPFLPLSPHLLKQGLTVPIALESPVRSSAFRRSGRRVARRPTSQPIPPTIHRVYHHALRKSQPWASLL